MHIMSLSSPDEQYYMDIGATSHITRSQGTLMNYSPLTHHLSNAIVVGNGHMIPVHGHGHISLPSSHKPLTIKMSFMPQNLLKISFPFATLLMIIWFQLNLIFLAFL